jgi:hypothetical protein
MSNLDLAPEPDRSFLPAIVVAVLVLIVIAVIVFLVNPRETAVVSVDKVQTYSPHTELKPMPGTLHVLGAQAVAEDDLYVVAKLRITDKLRLPIFVTSTTVTLTGPDGNAEQATAVAPVLYPRLEEIFPVLTPMLTDPLNDGDEISPGQTRSVTVLLLFPNTTEEMWHNRKSAVLTIALRNQAAQTVTLPNQP